MYNRRFILTGLASLPLSLNAQQKLKIIASFSIIENILREVTGDEFDIMSLVPAGEDMHHLSLKSKQLVALNNADYLFTIGHNFEPKIPFKGKLIVLSKGLELTGNDPHLWHSIPHVIHFVNVIEKTFNLKKITDNSIIYLDKLKDLHEDISKLFNSLPVEKRKVITTHDAFGYFGKTYGIDFIAPQNNLGNEPSAKNIASVINQIKRENIKAIFIEGLKSSRAITQISGETGVKIGGTLYADSLSKDETANSYLKMMRGNAETIYKALL